jgi:hypothetical protein
VILADSSAISFTFSQPLASTASSPSISVDRNGSVWFNRDQTNIEAFQCDGRRQADFASAIIIPPVGTFVSQAIVGEKICFLVDPFNKFVSCQTLNGNNENKISKKKIEKKKKLKSGSVSVSLPNDISTSANENATIEDIVAFDPSYIATIERHSDPSIPLLVRTFKGEGI